MRRQDWFKISLITILATSSIALSVESSVAQAAQKAASSDASALAQRGIELVSGGNCREALPVLKKAIPRIIDKQLRYSAEMASVRCAMSLDDVDTAVAGLLRLNHEYQHDPEVLYITTHYFSELANRASEEIAAVDPTSYQAHELDAEAYESQGKWDEAAAEYNQILEKNPKLPGIHYRLGRILLVRPQTSTSIEDAKKEFEEELEIDPTNASSEYALGEIARQAQQWEVAEGHYLKATQLDHGFLEAFLGLGMSLNALGKYAEAVAPLEKYVQGEPPDPAGHYQLAIAYARTGRKEESDRQMALQKETESKVIQGGQRTPGNVLPQKQ